MIFASAGVYRFCKYRTGFGEGFSTRLRHIRSSLEVAADTLHPDWRDLLQVIGQQETRQYHGHPHEWVTVTGRPAVPLSSTYEHLQLPNGFHFRFIDECVLDTAAFGTEDPRRVPEIDPDVCLVCKERQSDEIEKNHCSCFSTLFGGVRNPVPVQLFHTTSGKNNGVIARSVSSAILTQIRLTLSYPTTDRTSTVALPLANSQVSSLKASRVST